MRKPGEHRRHRGRKFDLPENLRARRLEGAGEIDQVGIDGAHRGQHIDHDREEHDQDGDQDFRIDRETHPQNEQRRERHLGRDLQRQDIGRQRELRDRRHAEHIADEGAEQAAEDEAGQHFGDGDAGVQQQMVEAPGMAELGGDRRQRRHDEGRNAEQARSPLPRRQKHHQQRRRSRRFPCASARSGRRRSCATSRRLLLERAWPISSRSISRAT